MIKILLKNNVYQEALARINRLYDEFPVVVASFSGGKDSTVILNLALEVAKERDRLPVPVLFIDQEAEWGSVIEYVKAVMYDPQVKPYWLQIPIKLFNSTSHGEDEWLKCWDPDKESLWTHPKDEIAIKENVYDTDFFYKVFDNFFRYHFPDSKACLLGGVRVQESPSRGLAVTQDPTYKEITWGKKLNRDLGHYTFYPIYDWGLTDVWKYINDNRLEYCKIYDFMYQYGVPPVDMRVSNVHHETALHSLFFMQEVEPDTWEKLVQRLPSVNTTKHISKNEYYAPKKLPFMFETWEEYRDFLLERIIEPKYRSKFKRRFDLWDRKYTHPLVNEHYNKVCVRELLINDWWHVKLHNFENNPEVMSYLRWTRGKLDVVKASNKYIRNAMEYELKQKDKNGSKHKKAN